MIIRTGTKIHIEINFAKLGYRTEAILIVRASLL